MVMVPAQAGGRMGGCETTPPDSRTGPPGSQYPRPRRATTQRAFLARDHRPPLAGVKLVRPRPRPDGREGLRALQLDPRPRSGREPSATRKPSTTANPANTRPPGQDSTRSLTAKAPMGGWIIGAALSAAARAGEA